MQDINITVAKQHIEVIDPPRLIAGTKNYLLAKFSFDSTWAGFMKVAVFCRDYPVAIRNNQCVIPEEVTDRSSISVKVIGRKDDVQIVTDFAVIKQG